MGRIIARSARQRIFTEPERSLDAPETRGQRPIASDESDHRRPLRSSIRMRKVGDGEDLATANARRGVRPPGLQSMAGLSCLLYNHLSASPQPGSRDRAPCPESQGPTFMYEHRSQPLLPRSLLLRRSLGHGLLAFSLVLVALGIGLVGHHLTDGLPWLDALLNASMILGGMGPVNELRAAGGKLFASAYALFSGMAFLAAAGIVVAPLAHRLLHRLHLETGDP